MEDLLAARIQMAVSLGFHIIFACIGMAMPFMMAAAHGLWLKTQDDVYLSLTKTWSKGVAIFFAVGAVSGTALSFELGLLWPGFMEHAGSIIGMPFSWEGTAFFVEAIALGLFLYGWGRIPPWTHWGCGLVVGISGLASGFFVVCANAWMNAPAGFEMVDGKAINIDPWAAMFNERYLNMGIHMLVASFQATGFAVAGLHSYRILKGKSLDLHRKARNIALVFAGIASILQPISGDILAKETAEVQPLKLAAMEAHFETEKGAPLIIGGWPDVEERVTRFAIKIPNMLSFLAFGDFQAEVKGLNDFPEELWPPVLPTHIAFQVMVGIGTLLIGVSLLSVIGYWKRRELLESSLYLKLLAMCTPLGFIAVEAGWCVTELGRQPWIIYGVMKTKDALTPMPGLWLPMLLFFLVYMMLCMVLVWLMKRQVDVLERKYP